MVEQQGQIQSKLPVQINLEFGPYLSLAFPSTIFFGPLPLCHPPRRFPLRGLQIFVKALSLEPGRRWTFISQVHPSTRLPSPQSVLRF